MMTVDLTPVTVDRVPGGTYTHLVLHPRERTLTAEALAPEAGEWSDRRYWRLDAIGGLNSRQVNAIMKMIACYMPAIIDLDPGDAERIHAARQVNASIMQACDMHNEAVMARADRGRR